MCPGSGSWTRMPSISSRAVEVVDHGQQLRGGRFKRQAAAYPSVLRCGRRRGSCCARRSEKPDPHRPELLQGRGRTPMRAVCSTLEAKSSKTLSRIALPSRMRAAMLNSESYQTARPVPVRVNQMISELLDSTGLLAPVANEPRIVTCRGSLVPSVDAAKMRDTLQHCCGWAGSGLRIDGSESRPSCRASHQATGVNGMLSLAGDWSGLDCGAKIEP